MHDMHTGSTLEKTKKAQNHVLRATGGHEGNFFADFYLKALNLQIKYQLNIN